MSIPVGSFRTGPENATLTVRTGTAGAMAKAGHSLEIRVTTWSAELELGEDPATGSLTLEADSSTFQVIDGVGGPKALTDDDKAKIAAVINDRVLKKSTVSFRSTSIAAAGDGLAVQGELTLLGTPGPVEFTVALGADEHIAARTEIVQTAFGMTPYSAMMGALKVKDELVIEIDGQLQPA